MGSFIGHALPGSLFLLVGLWHIWSTVVRCVEDPKRGAVMVWNPVPRVSGNLRYAELYVIVVGSFIDMCIEFLYSTHLRIFVDGALNPSHMNDFEHAAMLLMFFIFGLTLLLSQKTRYLPLPEGALQCIGTMAFLAEYLLFSFHSTSHAGLEGRYHQILVLLVGLCIVASLLGAAFRTSSLADLLNGIALALQGLWFYQTAFSLYGPMIPSGCSWAPDGVHCKSKEHQIRGQYLANFQLCMIVVSLLTAVMLLYGFVAASTNAHLNPSISNGEHQSRKSGHRHIVSHASS